MFEFCISNNIVCEKRLFSYYLSVIACPGHRHLMRFVYQCQGFPRLSRCHSSRTLNGVP